MWIEMEKEETGHSRTLRRAKTGVLSTEAENRMFVIKYGLFLEEVEALRENFAFSDADNSGMIDPNEARTMLKNCGCEPTTKLQRESIATCMAKLEKVGGLEFPGMISLVVDHYTCCWNAIKETCQKIIAQHGTIPIDQLTVILYEAGHFMPRNKVYQLLSAIGIDVSALGAGEGIGEDDCQKMMKMCRIQVLREWRSTYGFKDIEICHFRETFQNNCKDGKTTLPRHSVPDVMEAVGHAFSSLADGGEILQECFIVSLHGEEEVSWDRFLLLLKQFEMQQAKEKGARDQEVAEQLGFSEETYKEIRRMFEDYDHTGDGLVAKSSIRSLFSSAGAARTQKQRKALRESLEEFPGDGIDLIQFLHTFRKLTSTGDFDSKRSM